MENKSNNSNLSAKDSLAKLLLRKYEQENELKTLEKQIYNVEGKYIEDTCNYGNVMKGWERYLLPLNKSNEHSDKKNKRNSNDYRLFTKSSVTADNIDKSISIDEEINNNSPGQKKTKRQKNR